MITFNVNRDVETVLNVLKSIKRNRESITEYKLYDSAGDVFDNPALNDLDQGITISKLGHFITLVRVVKITIDGVDIPDGEFDKFEVDSMAEQGNLIKLAIAKCKNSLPGNVLDDDYGSILDSVVNEATGNQNMDSTKNCGVVEIHHMCTTPDDAAADLAEQVKTHLENGRKVVASTMTYVNGYINYLVTTVGVKGD